MFKWKKYFQIKLLFADNDVLRIHNKYVHA